MTPTHLGVLFTLAGIGLVVVTSYIFAVGEQMQNRQKRLLSSLTGILLAVVGTASAFKGLWVVVLATSIPADEPLGGLVVIAWAAAWFSIITALTHDSEQVWKSRLEALR